MLEPQTQMAFQQSVSGMAGKMGTAVGVGTPTQATLASISMRVQNQVFMLSFNQLMVTVALIFMIAFIPLALIRFKHKPTGPIDAH
ncbi:hypothetical protein D3C87_1795860 [compost metagenome]